MTSNFDFLKPHYPKLHQTATEAEKLINNAPRASCFYARYTLEQAVIWLYENEPYLEHPKTYNLGALIHEQTFKDNLQPNLFPKLCIIQKIGNAAAHDPKPITSKDARYLIQELYHFLYWLTRYYSRDGKNLPNLKFNPDLIPTSTTKSDLTLDKLQQLETQLSTAQEMQRIAEQKEKQTTAELETAKAELAQLKQQNQTKSDRHDYNEADTRTYLLDILLKEAGWPIHLPESTEYQVTGMPNETGKGKIDYVFWGDDGNPLAIVEAKRTRKSPQTGQHQAKLYADCLQAEFNHRPVIFYSNGYEHWIWDDFNYPPRPIQGFLKKDELERLIFRRSHRQPLHTLDVNPDIAGRCYQKEAICCIKEIFDNKQRKALLVMATGTGKTRTAVSLVELLERANWVKRVLFLADRNVLLTQAQGVFNSNLNSITTANLTEKKQDAENATIVFSTYPTISNRINATDGDKRLFSPGYFDLVIVDEAHRSIYRKYRQIFQYFDALLLGLTATPRNEVDRDTYSIFDLEPGVPTFAYELDSAIKDGYLVPPSGVEVPFKFMRAGIRYSELLPEEKTAYEERFADAETGEVPDKINATALNTWLFNISTVDQALQLLMERGLKVEGGDRLGKTIIFARNHKHAEFISERFNANYPHYKGQFAQIIDSQSSYSQSLLDDFSKADKQPIIAVSVDMLDTGVDVQEVVNLVFFKPVYSRIKFNQMIGRGTRLCPNLFAPGDDKTEFLVFDLCSNFSYFEQQIDEKNVKIPDSLTTKLIKSRLELSQLVPTGELKNNLLDELHQYINSMPKDNFLVRPHLQQVEEFSQRERWNELGESDQEIIGESLASLPNGLPKESHLNKRFDLICVKLQLALLKQSTDFIRLRDNIRDICSQLAQKSNIPMIAAKLQVIEEVQAEEWWRDITVEMVSILQQDLRELVKFIDSQEQKIMYVNFADEMGEVQNVNVPTQTSGFSPLQYKKKVEAYIRSNENNVAVAKLKRNIPLTDADLTALEEMLFNSEVIEDREIFAEVYGQNISLKLFIRKLVGLDRNAAKELFSKYLNSKFNTSQIRFVENIIDYLTQNGVMSPELLYEPPFTDLHTEGLDGIFADKEADNIIEILTEINESVDYDVA